MDNDPNGSFVNASEDQLFEKFWGRGVLILERGGVNTLARMII